MKDIVVLYHRNCPDGMASAYSAWKKLGDTADYIAMSHGQGPAPEFDGKQVYMLDYSFNKDVLLDFEKRLKRLVVIDHHMGARESVESVKEHIFNNDHSGAGLSWRYFHPDTQVPRLINYIEDNDIARLALPHSIEFATYMSAQPLTLEHFDTLCQEVESDAGFNKVVERGRAYREYIDNFSEFVAGKAEEVEFEGHKVFAVNAKLNQHLRDEVGIQLTTKIGRPFAIMWNEDSLGRGFSMRADRSTDIDLAKIAQKYGGNGHKGASSFRTKLSDPLPFTYIK